MEIYLWKREYNTPQKLDNKLRYADEIKKTIRNLKKLGSLIKLKEKEFVSFAEILEIMQKIFITNKNKLHLA